MLCTSNQTSHNTLTKYLNRNNAKDSIKKNYNINPLVSNFSSIGLSADTKRRVKNLYIYGKVGVSNESSQRTIAVRIIHAIIRRSRIRDDDDDCPKYARKKKIVIAN